MKILKLFIREDVQIVLDEFDKRGEEMLNSKWTRVIDHIFHEANIIEAFLLRRKKIKLRKTIRREEAHEMLMLRLLGQDKDLKDLEATEKTSTTTSVMPSSPYINALQQLHQLQKQQQQQQQQHHNIGISKLLQTYKNDPNR